jgi:5-methylcytosine-specific restriction endonuclease McrA
LAKHTHCESCGEKATPTYSNSIGLEMDHIIALIFGGHPWHEDNLAALCPPCHKKKTKSDVQILAWWKRQANYDTGPLIIEEIITYQAKLIET